MKKINILMYVFVISVLLSSCGKSPEQQIAEQLELGQKCLLEQNYEQAIVVFTKVIELDPKSASAYVGRGDTYVAWANVNNDVDVTDKYNNAIYDYETALELSKNNELTAKITDIYMVLAERYGEESDQGQSYLEMAYQWSQDEALLMRIQEMKTGIVLEKETSEIKRIKEQYQLEDYEMLYHGIMEANWIKQLSDKYKGKEYYSGETKNYMPNGFGVMIYGAGTKERTIIYLGNWRDGKRDGWGLAVWEKDSEQGYYFGEWSEDIQNGDALEYVEYDTRVNKRIGTAENGIAEGTYQNLFVNSDGNISGYEFLCQDGVPQSYGMNEVNGGIVEETMALIISGEQKQPVWHTWSGLRCKECNADIDEGVRLLNAFDHSWAGWIDKPRRFTFLNAD